jgi:dynein heavy chain 1
MDNYQMNLCLYHMWDADMLKPENDKAFNDIMTRARGEAILEKTVRNISETWEEKLFQLTDYKPAKDTPKRNTTLIKGWNDLISQIDEHINDISSSKNSPYYKVY